MWIKILTSGIKQQLTEKAQLVGRLFIYFMIVYLFFQVFRSVDAPKSQFSYLALTQLISLSSPMIAFQIAQDIQNGQFAHFLLRPVFYIPFRLAEHLGESLIRYFLFSLFYLTIQPISLNVLKGLLFGIAGVFLYSLISILIGICSIWLQDIKQFVYINLTATFCFGALIVPLSNYPSQMQSIAMLTPYPWILWWPAATASGLTVPPFALHIWAVWVFILMILITIAYRKGIKTLITEGL